MIWLTSFKFNIVTIDQVPGDLASQYNDFLLTEEVLPGTKLLEGDLMIKQNGQLVRPVRLPNGLYKFRFCLFFPQRIIALTGFPHQGGHSRGSGGS